MSEINRRWHKSMFRGMLPNWWWAIITFRPQLSVLTCSSHSNCYRSRAWQRLSVSRPCACLCQSTSQHLDKPLSEKGCVLAITSTSVTITSVISSSDVSLLLSSWLIDMRSRHPHLFVCLSPAVSLTLFVRRWMRLEQTSRTKRKVSQEQGHSEVINIKYE